MLASCLEEEVKVTSHILIRTVSDVLVLKFRLEVRFYIQSSVDNLNPPHSKLNDLTFPQTTHIRYWIRVDTHL